MQRIIKDLKKDFINLYNLLNEIDQAIYDQPYAFLVKSRVYIEELTKEIATLEKLSYLNDLQLADRLKNLKTEGVLDSKIDNLFYEVRISGNKAAHSQIEGELIEALKAHKNIFDITAWFITCYVNAEFEEVPYRDPKPNRDNQLLKKLLGLIGNKREETDSEAYASVTDTTSEVEQLSTNNTQAKESAVIKRKDSEQSLTLIESNCLVDELAKLKQSSREAVEGLQIFSDFKKYMHVERDVQNELEQTIKLAAKSEHGKLIMVCGSVGDGKSHIISYFKNHMPDIIEQFDLTNDATESLDPTKTSMETLNILLEEFSDSKIEHTTKKMILAINLGTLNNFIDSPFGENFTKLKLFVEESKILENSVANIPVEESSPFQYVNFTDYHLYTLKNENTESKYIKTLTIKVTDKSENNLFYKAYKKNCITCPSNTVCPIKANYEMLSNEVVQEALVQLLIKAIVKDKLIISTRSLLNFIYEILVSKSELDINSNNFKQQLSRLSKVDYVNALLPNILFEHRELSVIFDALSHLDPLNSRSQELDEFIIEYYNTHTISEYFRSNVELPEDVLTYIEQFNESNADYKKIKVKLLKLFVRSYLLCGNDKLFSLEDKMYNDYIKYLYYYNKGSRQELKQLYSNIKDSIYKWNGLADKNHLNIFIGKNQMKYKISEEVELKAYVNSLPTNTNIELIKFNKDINLDFKTEKKNNVHTITIDFQLFDLLNRIVKGYRPDKNDKNHFIKFIDFINKLEKEGSHDTSITFIEKNKDVNRRFRLEYNDEFNEYRFVEM